MRKDRQSTYPKRYSTDISAAWEFEPIFNQDIEIREKYIEALSEVVSANLGVTPIDDFWSLVYASPADRCKAALLAMMGQEAS